MLTKSKLLCPIVVLLTSSMSLAQDVALDSADKDYSSELPRIAPLSPDQALQAFEVADGYEVQLVACEPLVTDPVAFAFDAQGRLWVAEMRDYSEQDTQRLGRIALLTDTDGDGRMDRRTTFVENLSWPTAIIPWLDGALVAAPPDLTWYRDTDGDGISDHSEVWYSGFGRSNVQGLVNSLRWGVDGWIHGATSSTGASLESANGNFKMDIGRRDFAIDPITRVLKPETGGGQHGMSFNRWGDKFVTSNSDHLQQIVDMESWLASNPSGTVSIPALRRSIAEDGPQAEVFRASPVEPWRIVRTRLRMSGVAPGIVEGGGRAAGYFTGATGTWIMDDCRGFGLPGTDTAIVCDVGSNLVHRKSMVDKGLYYSASRIDNRSELLRSRDIWFRPVQIGEGPDGSLYIADMYREVIEHPLSLPPMIKKHLDLTSGRDRGRIWRLAKKDAPTIQQENLRLLDNAALVDRLSSDISWQRLMASQLILEQYAQHKLDGNAIEGMLMDSALNAVRPEGRLLSLWLLDRLRCNVSIDSAKGLMNERHPRVLAHAIEVVAPLFLENPDSRDDFERRTAQQLLVDIAEKNKDARIQNDARVQLALAKSAALLDEEYKWKLLASLMLRAEEPLVRAIIAMSAGNRSWQLLDSDFSEGLDEDSYSNWLSLLLPGWIANVQSNQELADFVQQHLQTGHPRQSAWLTALCNTSSHSSVSSLFQFLNIQAEIDSHIHSGLEENLEARSIGWLGLASTEMRNKWMLDLIQGSQAESVQSAAISALGWADHTGLTEHLIERFTGLTPNLQRLVLRLIVSRPERLDALASGLESGRVARSQIPAEIRQILLSGPSKELTKRFSEVLTTAASDRTAVIAAYQKVLESRGLEQASAERGKPVFERSCAQCHRLGGTGNDVGPPLRQLNEKSPSQVLVSILDPSREVDPKYTAYTLLTVDGVVITGIILQEAGNQIVVAEAGGRQSSIDRNSLDQIQSSGLSLMPVGLEEQITPDQMLDLIQFLISQKDE